MISLEGVGFGGGPEDNWFRGDFVAGGRTAGGTETRKKEKITKSPMATKKIRHKGEIERKL